LLSDVVSCHGELDVGALVREVVEFFTLGDFSVSRVGKRTASHIGDKALHLHVDCCLGVVDVPLGQAGNCVVLHFILIIILLVVVDVELLGEYL
jgi:hypothetical protein